MRSDYTVAIHSLMLVAFYRQDSITSEKVARSIGCNPVIVRNVFTKLNKAGLLRTGLGRRRTELGRPAGEITLRDVYLVTVPENVDVFKMYEPNPQCPVGPDIHDILSVRFGGVRDAMLGELGRTTIADLVAELPPEKDRLPEALRD